MQAQRTLSKHVEVRESAIHGRGVFALRAIPVGGFIGRYTGRLYSASEAAERDWETAVTYVFGLSNGSLIDGGDGGNATRFINHSCAPNCVAYELEGEDGELWIEIEALQRLPAGTELFLDYKLDATEPDSPHYACSCGAATCRGRLTA